MDGSRYYASAGGVFRHVDGPFADGADPVADALVAEASGLGEAEMEPKTSVPEAIGSASSWAEELAKPWAVRHWPWLVGGALALTIAGLAVADVMRKRRGWSVSAPSVVRGF
jgi:hypothetical protein